jgi:hypothetical protein
MATHELEFETKSLMLPTELSRRGFLTTSLSDREAPAKAAWQTGAA